MHHNNSTKKKVASKEPIQYYVDMELSITTGQTMYKFNDINSPITPSEMQDWIHHFTHTSPLNYKDTAKFYVLGVDNKKYLVVLTGSKFGGIIETVNTI